MKKQFPLRAVILSALLAAVASALFLIQFSVPLVPSFLKMDVSDMPALVASLALGPWWGVLVCLVKNAVGLLHSETMFVGELSNLILSSAFALMAGLLCRKVMRFYDRQARQPYGPILVRLQSRRLQSG